jgi:aspartate 1-decarboxylase
MIVCRAVFEEVMGTIRLMHAKLHRVKVSETNVNYVGSIIIDTELLEKVGILPLQEVEIVNLNNGNRFATYVFPGEAGKKEICPNGGAALLCQPGDILIIYAYEEKERTEVLQRGHQALVLVANEDNDCEQFFCQTLVPTENKVKFESVAL